MMKHITLAAVSATLVGCGRPVDFKDGLPTSEITTVKTPTGAGQQSQPLVAPTDVHKRLQGEVAGTYVLTAAATTTVNGATLVLVGVLSSIVHEPATSVTGDTAVWGPYTPALSTSTWRLTVNRTGLNHFTYKLEGKPRGGNDTAYVTALSGTHNAAMDAAGNAVPNCGDGTLNAFWGQTSANPGSAQVTYSRPTPTSDITVDVSFLSGTTVTAKYAFKLTAAGEGTFQFATDPSTTTQERWGIESRWKADGSGRSDAKITGPALQATLSECWDTQFLSQYLVRSDGLQGWGSVSSCAFASPEYTSL